MKRMGLMKIGSSSNLESWLSTSVETVAKRSMLKIRKEMAESHFTLLSKGEKCE